jgi:hypothetical protein
VLPAAQADSNPFTTRGPDPLGSPMAILFPLAVPPPRSMQQKAAFERPIPAGLAIQRKPVDAYVARPPREEERVQGGSDSRNEGEKNVEISNYVTSPPSENSQHLTDFQGTLEPARDFGLERRGIAAVYAPRVDNRGGALIVARGG